MIPIVYYAHSMGIYDTEQERQELEVLQGYFFEYLIFNPNRSSIQLAVNPMQACFDIVHDESVTDLAFSLNERQFISLGVYAEIRSAQKQDKPVYTVDDTDVRLFTDSFNIVKHDKQVRWAEVLR